MKLSWTLKELRTEKGQPVLSADGEKMLLLGLHLSLLKLSLGGELLFHCIVSKIPLRLTRIVVWEALFFTTLCLVLSNSSCSWETPLKQKGNFYSFPLLTDPQEDSFPEPLSDDADFIPNSGLGQMARMSNSLPTSDEFHSLFLF